MRIINSISNQDYYNALLDAMNNEEYTNWSWAVSWVNNEYLYSHIIPNINKFKHLFLTKCWHSLTGGIENSMRWHDETRYAYNVLKKYSFVHFINAKEIFHPKVYVFYNENNSLWTAFVGSANLSFGLNFNIESIAVVSQDDDKDGHLFQQIMRIFEEDIPFSENITCNKNWIRRIEKKRKEQYELDCEAHIIKTMKQITDLLDPYIPQEPITKRNFTILTRYLKGDSKIDLSSFYCLKPETVRQICRKMCYVKNIKRINCPQNVSEDVKKIAMEISDNEAYKVIIEKEYDESKITRKERATQIRNRHRKQLLTRIIKYLP